MRIAPLAACCTAFVALALFTSADGPAPVNSAVVPEPRTNDNWKQRHAVYAARASTEKVDLLFLGDSITMRWEAEGRAAWNDSFAPRKAANFGIGGDRTQNVLWRLTTGGELGSLEPRAIVLLIGTNNLFHNSPAQIAAGVEAILRELRTRKPKARILLVGLLPRTGSPIPAEATEAPAESLNPKIGEVNTRLAKLAMDQVAFLDVGPKLLDAEGNLPKKWMPDYLHLSPEGYAILAEAIRPALELQVPGKSAGETRAKAAALRVDEARTRLIMWLSGGKR